MAHFRGGVQGGRGEATRLGHKTSGISAWVNSWTSKVSVSMNWHEDIQQDWITIVVTVDRNKTVTIFEGTESDFKRRYINALG